MKSYLLKEGEEYSPNTSEYYDESKLSVEETIIKYYSKQHIMLVWEDERIKGLFKSAHIHKKENKMTTENKKVYILQKDLPPFKEGTEFKENVNYYEAYCELDYMQLPKSLVEILPDLFKLKQEKLFTLRDAENIFNDSRLKLQLAGTIYNLSGYKYNNFLHYMEVNYGDIPTSKTFSEPWDKL